MLEYLLDLFPFTAETLATLCSVLLAANHVPVKEGPHEWWFQVYTYSYNVLIILTCIQYINTHDQSPRLDFFSWEIQTGRIGVHMTLTWWLCWSSMGFKIRLYVLQGMNKASVYQHVHPNVGGFQCPIFSFNVQHHIWDDDVHDIHSCSHRWFNHQSVSCSPSPQME